MSHRIILKSAIDGLIYVMGLVCLSVFVTSRFASNFSLTHLLLASLLEAILLAIVYLLSLIRVSSNKMVLLFSFGSTCWFILLLAMLFVASMTFSIDAAFVRELNNADGIIILFTTGCFIIFSTILRLSIFIVLLIKNTCLARGKQ